MSGSTVHMQQGAQPLGPEWLTSDQRQLQTYLWGVATIGDDVDQLTRASRFLEEATELTQATGMAEEMAHKIVSYVFARPVGEPFQEIGGTMVTLTMLAEVLRLSVEKAWVTEFKRIHQPEVMERIRLRQREKREAGL